MRPIASDFGAGGGALSVDWMRMSPYPAAGSFTSRVFDAGSSVGWQQLSADQVHPAATSTGFEVRSGNVAVPDASWSSFVPVSAGAINLTGRYLQYRATLQTSDSGLSPTLRSVTLSYGAAPPNQEPTFDQDLLDRTDAEGDVISLDAGATDPDGDPLTYAASGLPGGPQIKPTTGLITGTLANTAPAGSPYSVSVTVRDGTDRRRHRHLHLDRDQHQPGADLRPGPRRPDRRRGRVISLDAGATDPDGDPLTYAATSLPRACRSARPPGSSAAPSRTPPRPAARTASASPSATAPPSTPPTPSPGR